MKSASGPLTRKCILQCAEITEESEIEDIVEEENPKNEGEEVKANDADECLSSEKTEVNPLDLKYGDFFSVYHNATIFKRFELYQSGHTQNNKNFCLLYR